MHPSADRSDTGSPDEDGAPEERPSVAGRWRLLQWVRQGVHNLYAAGGILLLIGLAAAFIALWALAGLVDEVLAGETLRFDEASLEWLATFSTDRRDLRALEITALGGGTVVLTVTVIAGTLLLLLGRRYYALLLALAVGGGWILSPVLKALFDRDRPQVVEWRTPHAGQASFPSGHAMMGMVLYVTLAYIVHRCGNRTSVSAAAIVVAAVLICLIGVTRVYLGVHYPSDVLAGYAVGFAWAMFCAAGVEMFRREDPPD
jgi:undecaprenyl-diphosphatase